MLAVSGALCAALPPRHDSITSSGCRIRRRGSLGREDLRGDRVLPLWQLELMANAGKSAVPGNLFPARARLLRIETVNENRANSPPSLPATVCDAGAEKARRVDRDRPRATREPAAS